VIVVVGLPAYVGSADGTAAAAGGLAADVAAAAQARGAQVELVGKVGDDGAGDAVVVALGRAGIGHAALLRDSSHPTPVLAPVAAEPAPDGSDEYPDEESAIALLPEDPAARPSLDAGDIDLALKYLPGAKVIVIAAAVSDAAIATAAEAAAYAGARLIVLLPAGAGVLPAASAATAPAMPAEATVLEAPLDDDGSFARVVGAFAAALEAGTEPASAFTAAVASSGWEPAAD
jgi:ribokinase